MKWKLVLLASLLFGVTASAQDAQVDVQGGKVKVKTDGRRSVEVNGNESGEASAGSSEESADLISIQGAGQNVERNCDGKSVSVSGSGNSVRLHGECKRVEVTGSGQAVEVDTVAVIAVTGSSNKVTYANGANGKKPKISKSGLGNSVTKKK